MNCYFSLCDLWRTYLLSLAPITAVRQVIFPLLKMCLLSLILKFSLSFQHGSVLCLQIIAILLFISLPSVSWTEVFYQFYNFLFGYYLPLPILLLDQINFVNYYFILNIYKSIFTFNIIYFSVCWIMLFPQQYFPICESLLELQLLWCLNISWIFFKILFIHF